MRGRLSISGLRFVGRTHGAPSLVRRSWPPRIDNPAGTWIAGAFISQRKQGQSRPSQPENGVRRSGSVIYPGMGKWRPGDLPPLLSSEVNPPYPALPASLAGTPPWALLKD